MGSVSPGMNYFEEARVMASSLNLSHMTLIIFAIRMPFFALQRL